MAFFDDALKILGQIAPTIATALGGPVAGLAVAALGDALGLPGADKDQILKTVAGATPDQLLAIKQADQDFAVRMRELDIDVERIAAADRKSARDREAQLGDRFVPFLASLIVAAGFATAACVLAGWSKTDSTIAGAIIGYVFAQVQAVTTYYFGSSLGSTLKTRILGKNGGG